MGLGNVGPRMWGLGRSLWSCQTSLVCLWFLTTVRPVALPDAPITVMLCPTTSRHNGGKDSEQKSWKLFYMVSVRRLTMVTKHRHTLVLATQDSTRTGSHVTELHGRQSRILTLACFSQDKGEKNPTQVLFLWSESNTVLGQGSLHCYDTSQSR